MSVKPCKGGKYHYFDPRLAPVDGTRIGQRCACGKMQITKLDAGGAIDQTAPVNQPPERVVIDTTRHEQTMATTLAALRTAFERSLIIDTLFMYESNKSETARHLGMSRQGLNKAMRRLEIK